MAKIENFVARKDSIASWCEGILNADKIITEVLADAFGAFSENPIWKYADYTQQLCGMKKLAEFLRDSEKESDLSGSAWSRGLLAGAPRSASLR